MGYQVKRAAGAAALLLTPLLPDPAVAQDAKPVEAAGTAVAPDDDRHAVGTDFFISSDADKTEVIRAGLDLDLHYRDPERYWGVRFEKAWYKLAGGSAKGRDRGYLLYADKSASWAWSSELGTDGRTVLGSASIHNSKPLRQEYFIERDLVETRLGLARGLYSTFVGSAFDLPANDRNAFTVVAGVQDFTGRNVRLHLRGTYTHVVAPAWGLSVQLRGRYFYNTHPGEFDYYSPRWHAQILPVLQMRRYSGGWRYMLAAGLGAQRDANADWRQLRFATAEVSSPVFGKQWFVKASVQYNNTPQPTGVYDYAQFSIAFRRSF